MMYNEQEVSMDTRHCTCIHDTRVFTRKTGLEVHTSIYMNQNK